MKEYTPGQVWSILVTGSKDPSELLDVNAGLGRIDPIHGWFLMLIAEGYPVRRAMEKTGLHGNQTRLKRNILQELTELINGETNASRD